MAATDGRTVVLGKVSGLFGVRGWIKIHSYTDPREAILDYPQWRLSVGDRWRRFDLVEGRRQGKTIVARLRGFDDRDGAAEIVGALIGVSRSALPDAGSGQYYWSDLEGLIVEGRDGALLGTVAYLLETGANDVLVVKSDDKETLIPFVTGDVIQDVDLAAGVIRVDWDWD